MLMAIKKEKNSYSIENMKKIWSYKKGEDGGLILTKYKGEESVITVPERIGKTNVTALGNHLFQFKNNIEKVILPPTITTIGSRVFLRCNNLVDIELSPNIAFIDFEAFKDTPWLNNIEEDIIYIGKCLYQYKDKASQYYKVKEGTLGISPNSFASCTFLQYIDLPSSLTRIGYSAFSGCSSLKRVVVPEGVTRIDGATFINCSSLEGVILPDGIDYIGMYAFQRCSSLKKFIFPNKMDHFPFDLFFGCSSLESITIGKNMTSIMARNKDRTLLECPSLKELIVEEGNPIYCSINNCVVDKKEKRIVLGCSESYIDESSSITSIGRSAFENSGIKNIVIPSSIKVIEERAFFKSHLERVEIEEGLIEIKDEVFRNCYEIRSINIPDSASIFGEDVFCGLKVDIIASKGHKAHDILERDRERELKRLWRF